MKRFFAPLFAAAMFACAPAPKQFFETKPTVVVAAVEELPPQPTKIDKGDWSLTLPVGWKYDDTPQLQGAVATRVLDATSGVKVGRGPLKVGVNTVPLSKAMPDELFALAIAENSEEMFEASMAKAEQVEVDGHTSALIVLVKEDVGVGLVVLASGRGKVGYVVTCSGDALVPFGEVTAKTCLEVLKTFHAK